MSRWVLPVVVLAAIAVASFRPIADSDTHWHLAAGRIMLDRGEVLTTDPLSWTIQGKRWVNHEWLAEVLFAVAERGAGLTGVRLLTTGVIVLGFLVPLALARSRTGDVRIASGVIALAFVLYLFRIRERPHVWTPFLFYAVYAVLLRPDLAAWRKAALAVVVSALWANLHAGALVVALLLGAFAIGSARVARREAAVYALAAGLSALAVCATPNGFAIWEFAFTARGQTHLVPEWKSLWTFGADEFLREKGLFVGVCAVWAWSLLRHRRDADPRETWPCLLAVALAASAVRFLFFLVVPLLQVARLDRAERWARGASIVALVVGALVAAWDFGDRLGVYRGAGLGPFDDVYYPNYPVKAVDYLSELQLQGHGVVSPEWAGYLSWRLWPRYLTFVDGRTPDFGDRLCEDAVVMTLPPAPGADREAITRERERLLDAYGIDWVLARRPYFGDDDRVHAGRWVPVHADDLAVVYVRNDGPHARENGDAVIEHARTHPNR